MSAAVVILGSGGAMLTSHRDNTALAFRMDEAAVLIDCPGSAYLKLLRAGIDPLRLAAVVITHTHPDHIYGLPSLIHNLWMMGLKTPLPPLPVYAPEADLAKLQRLLAVFDLDRRAEFPRWYPLPDDAAHPFLEHKGHRFYAHPVDHGPPAYAIRWDAANGRRVLYSTDTRPVEALAEFGRGAVLFIHEATYLDAEAQRAGEAGHSTASQAGRIAALADARRMLLVHLTDYADPASWVEEARKTFGGLVDVPDDGAVYEVT